jgi:selenocysteine lyase/cysteine desulfurase
MKGHVERRVNQVDKVPQSENGHLWSHFQRFAEKTVGHDATYRGANDKLRSVHYFDWTASGRLYAPIEHAMSRSFGPLIANTHTESSRTGQDTTEAYHHARDVIKTHVNADPDRDVLVVTGSGATGAVNKLQRILGLKFNDQIDKYSQFTGEKPQGDVFSPADRPVVFVTHMEHHSNQTSWIETEADVVGVPAGDNGSVDPQKLRSLLDTYKGRKTKIGAFTAASNVTGIKTPVGELAKVMHEAEGGIAFFDYAAAAPYVDIDMNPEDPLEKPDAIYFSPHKFLGGPGTTGVLIFDKGRYPEGPPDHPGGGTVAWTNPWGGRRYAGDVRDQITVADIEIREDGGTPPFMQTIKTALAIELKETMGTEAMLEREEHLVDKFMDGLAGIEGYEILEPSNKDRLGIVSFRTDGLNLNYNLVVKILSDEYGVQTRGGCSCAGTYGHELFSISPPVSAEITDQIDHGDHTRKPGWVRVSLHPTNSDEEVDYLLNSLKDIADNGLAMKTNYTYDKSSNEWTRKGSQPDATRERIVDTFASIRATF